MTRLFLAITIAVASLAASISQAPSAHAGQPTRISGTFGVNELYPKTIKRYKAAKKKLARLKRAYRSAQRARDTARMAKIQRSFKKTLASAQKALRTLKKVRGVATVIVWGDAGDKMPRSKIASFLRKKTKWQGRTVHIYARNGKLKVGGGAPRTYDDRKNHRRGTRRQPGRGATPTPVPFVTPPNSGRLGGSGRGTSGGVGSGVFGLG